MSRRRRPAASARASGGARAPVRRPRDRAAPVRPRPRSLFRALALAGFLAAAVVAVAGIFALSGGPGGSAGAAPAGVRPFLGDPGAAVVIEEYGDFQCPSCGAFARGIEPELRAAYIDTGLARMEWHDFPWIGQESRDAANAARCAGDQGKFWDFHDLLYRTQAGENSGAFARDRLKALGATLGLEPGAFGTCVDSGTHGGAVQADFATTHSLGMNGTPTFIIGGQRIVGAQPFEVFASVIDGQLGR